MELNRDSKPFINEIIRTIEQLGEDNYIYKAKLLSSLQNFLLYRGDPIYILQTYILKQLIKSDWHYVIMDFKPEIFTQFQNSQSQENSITYKEIPGELLYLINTIEILAKTCKGKHMSNISVCRNIPLIKLKYFLLNIFLVICKIVTFWIIMRRPSFAGS